MQSFAEWFDGTMDLCKSAIRACLEHGSLIFKVFSDFWVGAGIIISVFVILLAINIVRGGRQFSAAAKNPRCLTICAVLIAANAVLGYFTITFTSYLRIGFGFITTPIAAFMFGPLVGGAVAVLSDIVSFALKPTGGFLFTYTLCTGIAGMIYGMVLYGKKLSPTRVFLCKLLVIFAVNIILNSIALAPTAGSGMIGILPSRIIKILLLWPIQGIVVYEVLKMAVKGRIGYAQNINKP